MIGVVEACREWPEGAAGCCCVLAVGSAIASKALNVRGGISLTRFSCRPRPNAAAFGTLFWAIATRAFRASLTGRVVIVSSSLRLCSQSNPEPGEGHMMLCFGKYLALDALPRTGACGESDL